MAFSLILPVHQKLPTSKVTSVSWTYWLPWNVKLASRLCSTVRFRMSKSRVVRSPSSLRKESPTFSPRIGSHR